MDVAAQLLYVTAPAGRCSFFIYHMTTPTPPVPESRDTARPHRPGFLPNRPNGWSGTHQDGMFGFRDQGAANLAPPGFLPGP